MIGHLIRPHFPVPFSSQYLARIYEAGVYDMKEGRDKSSYLLEEAELAHIEISVLLTRGYFYACLINT